MPEAPKNQRSKEPKNPRAVFIWFLGSSVLGISLAALGCGQHSQLMPVTGRVLLEDKPVPNMIVNFTPLGDTAGNGALAHTDADGRFTVLDARGDAGAYAGEYKISFYPGVGRSNQTDPRFDVVSVPSQGGLPAIYLDPNQTPLRATIPQGGAAIEVLLTRSGTGASVKTTPRANN
jgi:hypothetical protein